MTNVGTFLKFNVSLSLPGGFTMDDVDFTCEFFVYSDKVFRVAKADMVKVDENNYIAVVDTTKIGAGKLKLTVTAYVPDGNKMRPEIETIDTGVYISELYQY